MGEKSAKKPKAKAAAVREPVKPNTATAKTKAEKPKTVQPKADLKGKRKKDQEAPTVNSENVKKAKTVKSRVAEADKPKKTPTKKIGKKSCSCCSSEELEEKLTIYKPVNSCFDSLYIYNDN